MPSIRKIVSGKRNRLIADGFDLDLTYITDRIIAMSFPAHKFAEKIYRNDIKEVAQFLDLHHFGKYYIYNMSNRDIDNAKFHDRVLRYEWEDHHSPSLLTLFEACDHMYKLRVKDSDSVNVVNCNAGKGRTGTTICCYLIYSGLSKNFMQALTYYGQKRFSNGRGVTQPSQQRYVQYFSLVYRREITSPSIKRLNRIVINTVPSSTGNQVQPCVEILDGRDFKLIWTDNPHFKYQNEEQKMDTYTHITYKANKDSRMVIHIYNNDYESQSQGVDLCGDIFFRIINKKNSQLICRFAINTSFVPANNIYELTKSTVDPDSIKKNKKFDNNFSVQLMFEDVCKECTPQMPINGICKQCIYRMKDEFN